MPDITVYGPGGITVRFPEGTPQAVIDEQMRQAAGMAAEQPPPLLNDPLPGYAAEAQPYEPGGVLPQPAENDLPFPYNTAPPLNIESELRGLGTMARGALDIPTFGFMDEINAGVRDLFSDRSYNDLLAEEQAYQQEMQQSPLYLAGQGMGLLATAPFMPIFGPASGATALGRGVNAGFSGFAYGAPYAFGATPGPIATYNPETGDPEFNTQRIANAAIGGAAGAAGGVLGQTAFDAGTTLARGASNLASRVFNPARATAPAAQVSATQRVGEALAQDMGQPVSFNPYRQAAAQVGQAEDRGIPMMLADTGGENTRALLRSATNTSPEARGVVAQAVQDRFETQGERLADEFANILGTSPTGDADMVRVTLEQAARRANQNAYNVAYNSPSAQAMWSADLEQLTASPVMQQAMRQARSTAETDRALTGRPFEDVQDVFVDNGLGGLTLNPEVGAIPNLEYWDHVQRNINDFISQAQRAGSNNAARQAIQLRDTLLGILDGAVPEYQAARQGAARAFGAQDALEAGQAAVTTRMGTGQFQRAFDALSEPEQQLFREGYADEMFRRLQAAGTNRNAVNQTFLNNPAARDRLQVVFGEQRANQLENTLRLETIFNQTRGALGNSTTAQQLFDLALAGGIGTAVSGMQGFDMSNPSGIFAALITFAARRAYARIDQGIATQVGQLLASGSRDAIQQAANILATTAGGNRALRIIDSAVTRGAALGGAQYVNEGITQ